MTYDPTDFTTVAFLGSEDGQTVPLGLRPSDVNRQAAALATIDFAAAQESRAAIQSITFDAFVGGSGDSLVVPGIGTSEPGASLGVWNSWSGQWVTLGSNTSTSPVEIRYTTSSGSEANEYFVAGTQTVNVSMASAAGQGNAGVPPQVTVSYVEVTVGYHRPDGSCNVSADCDQGQTCNAGVCGDCGEGQLQCGTVCVDPVTDPTNCGACGHQCGQGEVCFDGGCHET
jgi:hypothetical protein